MKNIEHILRFKSEEDYLDWESIDGNCICSIQNSKGKHIGELKEIDLVPLWNKGKIVSFDNPINLVREKFIETHFPIRKTCNWGIVDDNDLEVRDKLLFIEIK